MFTNALHCGPGHTFFASLLFIYQNLKDRKGTILVLKDEARNHTIFPSLSLSHIWLNPQKKFTEWVNKRLFSLFLFLPSAPPPSILSSLSLFPSFFPFLFIYPSIYLPTYLSSILKLKLTRGHQSRNSRVLESQRLYIISSKLAPWNLPLQAEPDNECTMLGYEVLSMPVTTLWALGQC